MGRPGSHVLLALQPLRKRRVFAGLLCVRSRLVRLRRVGLTPDSPRPIVGRSKENPLFAGPFWFVRTQVLLRACRRSGVRLLRPLPPDCSGTIQRTAPAGAIPAVAALRGQSGFSPETTRTLCRGSHTGGHRRGCRFPSATRRSARTWAAGCRPQQILFWEDSWEDFASASCGLYLDVMAEGDKRVIVLKAADVPAEERVSLFDAVAATAPSGSKAPARRSLRGNTFRVRIWDVTGDSPATGAAVALDAQRYLRSFAASR